MSLINTALLIIGLVITSYTLGFVAGTNSEWKDRIEKQIRGLDATVEELGRMIENQTREIEVLTQDLKMTKNGLLTNFEDVNRRLDEVEYTIQSEPDVYEITDRLNKMSDILVNLLNAEGSQGEMVHTTPTEEVPSYSLLDMIDEKEDESHAE